MTAKTAFELDYPAAVSEAQRLEAEVAKLIQPDMTAHNLARAFLLANELATRLREVERIMSLTHRQMCIEWQRLGMEWDGRVSIQAARVWMIDKVLNPNKRRSLVTLPDRTNG